MQLSCGQHDYAFTELLLPAFRINSSAVDWFRMFEMPAAKLGIVGFDIFLKS